MFYAADHTWQERTSGSVALKHSAPVECKVQADPCVTGTLFNVPELLDNPAASEITMNAIQKCCADFAVGVPNPPCVYARIRMTTYAR